MKIVGFSQLHNEVLNGNLDNWFRCMEVCDSIHIYDQASTDGSREVYEAHPNARVVYSPVNDFSKELLCKKALLEKLLSEDGDADWVLWLDGDIVLDGRLTYDSLRSFLQGVSPSVDGVSLGHYNLWRSSVHYRVDDQFHSKDIAGEIVLWRVKPGMAFKVVDGLHQRQHPVTITSAYRSHYSLIHTGFSTDQQILRKYFNYRSRGQSGWLLERLVSETTLDVRLVPSEVFPPWYQKSDTVDPRTKPPLREVADKALAYGRFEDWSLR